MVALLPLPSFFLLQHIKEGDDNVVAITFFFLCCYNATKKVTATLLPSPSFFLLQRNKEGNGSNDVVAFFFLVLL
jgi:hypothetical protein